MFDKSLSLVCPAAALISSNLAIAYAPVSLTNATLGNRGGNNISRPLSSTGEAPATHYGAHTLDDGLLSLLEDPTQKAALFPDIQFYAIDNPDGTASGISAFLTSLGLQVIPDPDQQAEE